ncbi:stealth conserved region 3 domain-containing protein [Kitasatospora sp. NBC_00315]|uniref:stealth conserved region 3 domain-containing protein n=1 Tax=Kitasatospora sp. NBC_00315 TaxID=2975963 RepID=UPI00324AB5B6
MSRWARRALRAPARISRTLRSGVRAGTGRTAPVAPPPAPAAPAAPPTPEELRYGREEELLARFPGFVRHQGLLAQVRDDLLSGDAFLLNFTRAAEALTAADVPFAPLPDGRPRLRLAITPGDRPAVLAALAEAFAGQPVYADLLGHDVTLGTALAEELPAAVAALEYRPEPEPVPGAEVRGESVPELDEADREPRLKVKGVRIYLPVVTVGGTLGYAAEHGCDLEFWDSAEPSRGAIASIAETPYGWWVPSLEPVGTIRIAGREYPTAEAFTRARPEDVTFPVDAVVTWVDDSDADWRGRRDRARAARCGRPSTGEGDGDVRFRNRDELRYCLRSIAMYAPWIRHVFLVTDDQTPSWLESGHPGVTVVPHRELFADRAALPVFNSHAIETQLHRIPGLAEHFLYFNDDVFLARPVGPELFFLGSGVSRFVMDERIIPPGGAEEGESEYVASQKTTRDLLEREYGRTTTQVLSHVPHALRRSLLASLDESFGEALARTARSVFRSGEDVAPITLAAHAGYMSGRSVRGRIDHRHIDVDSRDSLAELPELLATRSTDVFCLNDGVIDGVPGPEQDALVRGFLQGYFPVPGPFERADAPPEPVRAPGSADAGVEAPDSADVGLAGPGSDDDRPGGPANDDRA